jgi:small-conductance mechanosensitive channel
MPNDCRKGKLMDLRSLLATQFHGNALIAWLIAAGVFVLVLGTLAVLRRLLVRRAMKVASRTANGLDDLILDVVGRTHTIFLIVVALAAASLALTLGHDVREYIAMVLGAAFIVQLLVWGNEGIGFWVRRQARQNSGSLGTLTAVAFMARLMLWALMIVLLLDNFGIHVTTLIGALGVAGIAGALAAQTVLGDLFAAISIYLDKPFQVGDFIIFDEFLGTVSSVGLRSTRIASLSGEEVIVSNSDLLKSRIRNYKRMTQRRIAFQLGVAYGTPREKVERIPQIIRSAVEEQRTVRFDRSHLKGYSDSSIDFETVYYVLSPDYNLYMDIQQAINLVIMRRFEDEEIRFAHPVRVMRMAEGTAGGESVLVAEGAPARGQ